MHVTGLNIHPLKSGRAVPQTAVTVNLDGLAGDRRFMLVAPDGHFITQRDLQALARVEAEHVDGGVHLRMNGEELSVRFDPDDRLDVRVWSSDVNAAVAGGAANDVLSGWFGRPVKLVHMDAEAERFVGAEWAGAAAPSHSPTAFRFSSRRRARSPISTARWPRRGRNRSAWSASAPISLSIAMSLGLKIFGRAS